MRACDICGAVDALPRHVTSHPDGAVDALYDPAILRLAVQNGADDAAIAQLMDGTQTCRHFACCAAQGCPTCQQSIATPTP